MERKDTMHETEKPVPLSPVPANVQELTEALAAPFDAREVKFKPAVVSGHRALALAYVDARVIQDRLDEVLGVTGWQDEYECLPDGSVVCRLRLRLGDEWITKMDVGGQSEQPDEGDRRKAAFSDALKRAAVKFGVGRYLYRLPQLWCDYDPQKRQFAGTPTLPPSALPRPKPSAPGAKKPVRPAALSAPLESAKGRGSGAPALPANGTELQRRLQDYDSRLAKQGVCQPGDLMKHVAEAGEKAGFGEDMTAWVGPAILLAVEETRTFEAQARQRAAERKEVA
jgi:Rad52/22 family double-strand break repair protein